MRCRHRSLANYLPRALPKNNNFLGVSDGAARAHKSQAVIRTTGSPICSRGGRTVRASISDINEMEAIKWTCGGSNCSQLVTGGVCLCMGTLVALLIFTNFTRQNGFFKRMEKAKEKMTRDDLVTGLSPQVKMSFLRILINLCRKGKPSPPRLSTEI